ncbi:MAG: amidohydrolase family protein [Blastocatellia bacterium]
MHKTTPFGSLQILDAHTHFFSHRFFELLTAQAPRLAEQPDPVATAGEITGWVMPPRDPAELARQWATELDRHNVAAAMLIASLPGDEASVAAAVRACPDRFIGAFMFDPTKPAATARAQTALDAEGLRVICLFPAMHHYSVAENEGVREVVALAAARPGTAVFVHCGALSVGVRKKLGLPSRFDMRHGNPLDIYKLAAEFPTARFIVPHFGAGMFRETLLLADQRENVYIDTSSSNQWMKYEGLDLVTVLRRALAVAGPERLLFGTDSSFFPRGWHAAVYEAQVSALRELGVTDTQAAAMFGGNLRRLLNF